MRAVRCWGHGSLGFESASTFVCDKYGDTGDDVVLNVAGSLVFELVGDDDDWNLGDILLPKNVDVCASIIVDFSAIQRRCRELSPAVPGKAGDVLWLVLRGLDALQESGVARRRVGALESRRVEHLAKIDTVETREREALGDNCRLEHERLLLRLRKSVMNLGMWSTPRPSLMRKLRS